jgi:outer membrane murein-binding lipoprotein Lpp
MKSAVIAAVVLSSILLAGCFETTSLNSAEGTPDRLTPKRSELRCGVASMSRPRSAVAGKRGRNRHRYHRAVPSREPHYQRQQPSPLIEAAGFDR